MPKGDILVIKQMILKKRWQNNKHLGRNENVLALSFLLGQYWVSLPLLGQKTISLSKRFTVWWYSRLHTCVSPHISYFSKCRDTMTHSLSHSSALCCLDINK
jgi:hypothetical protein